MDLPLLKNLTEKDLKGKRIILRLDLNLSFKDGKVLDEYRIIRSLPTIAFLRERGARIIAISHHSDSTQTLLPVAELLKKHVPSVFIGDVLDKEEIERGLEESESVLLCENIRFHKEEEKGDETFAQKIAALGDIYVNDAFSASHRSHASITALPKFLPSYAGLLFEEEIQNLSIAFDPPHPFLFVIGGGKVRSKFHLIEKFLDIADTLYVGGALTALFFKKRGYEIGKSHFEDIKDEIPPLLNNKKIMLPVDVRVRSPVSSGTGRSGGHAIIKKSSDVSSDDEILDVGPETIARLRACVNDARFILWNGPLGDYLIDDFGKGTEEFIDILAESSAQVIVGGGDTMTLISRMGKRDEFDFISTGGGAMLEFLSERTLPGIEALRKN